MSKAIRIHEQGGPEVLRYEDVELPPLRAGEARVRHKAIGLNFIDTYHRSGLYALPALPSGLGMEAAGVIEALAPDVDTLRVGQRVAYAGGPPGAYAELRHIEARHLVPLPEGIDEESAAAALLKGMTVEYLIHRTYAVQPGQHVVWHAAAGGVGLLACQWLRAKGAIVIGTVGSAAKAELASSHGCHHPVVLGEHDLREVVRSLTQGRGVDVVYDSIGRDTFDLSLDCLAKRGMLVGFGNASGKPEPFDPLRLAQKGSLYLTRPTLMDYTASREELLHSAATLFDAIERDLITVHIAQRWPLAHAADAHRALEARQTRGSSLLLP